MTPTVLDLFSAAAGGWSLGMHRAGFVTVAACEAIAWRRALFQQNNPGVLIYDDVCTLTADRLVRDLGWLPDVVVGSPPCQDISSANTQGKGVDGDRSKLYFEAVRIIGECRPRWFALENSANLRTRGADRIIAALQAIGYAVEISVVGADLVGANHERKRSWIIGYDPNQVTDARSWEFWQQSGWWLGARRTCPQLDRRNDPAIGDADAAGLGLGARAGSSLHAGRAHERHEPADYPDVHAASIGREGGRARGHRPDGDSASSIAAGVYHAPDADGVGRHEGWSGGRGGLNVPIPIDLEGADSDGRCVVAVDAEMGGGAGAGGDASEPWSDWNGGLAHHLRVDDGISAWVAGARVALGSPRGTSAASLIVEAFGDAVVPQITEAIGRSIMRTEAALSAVYRRAA